MISYHFSFLCTLLLSRRDKVVKILPWKPAGQLTNYYYYVKIRYYVIVGDVIIIIDSKSWTVAEGFRYNKKKILQEEYINYFSLGTETSEF